MNLFLMPILMYIVKVVQQIGTYFDAYFDIFIKIIQRIGIYFDTYIIIKVEILYTSHYIIEYNSIVCPYKYNIC